MIAALATYPPHPPPPQKKTNGNEMRYIPEYWNWQLPPIPKKNPHKYERPCVKAV
jgi:hypothetical protein